MYYTIELIPDYKYSDQDVIDIYIKEHEDIEDIKATIAELRDLLTLEPFPEDWIFNLANRGYFLSPEEKIKISKREIKCPTTEDWIRWMIEALEEGVRKRESG